jgi:hypothetical protein
MLLCIFCFAACAKPDDTPTDVETEEDETQGGNATHDENGYELDSLPETLDFGNTEVNMLAWFATLDEFCFTDEIGVGVIAEAQYNQLDRVEDRLNIDITFNQIAGREEDKDTYLQEIENSNLSGDPYDLVSAYSGIGAMAAMRGLFQNLSTQKYIDFQKPWWPQDLQNSVAIEGNLFFASGDISPNVIYGLFSIIANMDLWENYYGSTLGNTYLYDLVDQKKWTLETMMNLSKDIYVDLDNNGKTDSDQYGFVFSNTVSIDAFLQGSGIDVTTRDSSGKLKMADIFFGQQMIDLVDKLGDFYKWEDVAVSAAYAGIFPEGRALFMDAKIEVCITKLADTELTYAALPVPMYDEAQKGYVTTMNHNFSVFGILTNLSADATDRAAATLEALASEAYRSVSPAIFEKAFRLRYSADSDVSRMYQYVRDGLKFEMARLYRLNFPTNQPTNLFRDCVRAHSSWYASVASNKGQWNRTLGTISDALKELAEKQQN